MDWDFHSLADAQNQRRGLPSFLPGAPDPDQNLPALSSNPGNQAWQLSRPLPRSFLPTVSLPPGLEYLSQVFFIFLFLQICSTLKINTNLLSDFSIKVERL